MVNTELIKKRQHDDTDCGAKEAYFFRSDIQGLRALAIVFVVFYHAKLPFFTGGYVGVDVFFVISGYLITQLIVRELEEWDHIDFLAFYARRIRRLLPAAMTALIATVVMARIWLSPLEQLELVPSILYSALYASNLWFASEATDYLANDVHINPFLHTWSLSVEEQFYIVWPLLILLGACTRSVLGRRVRLVSIMALVFITSLTVTCWMIDISRPWSFFGSPTRAWEFAAGGLAYMCSDRFRNVSIMAKDSLTAMGFTAMGSAVVLFDDLTRFPGLMALVPVVGAVLVLLAGAGSQGRIARWLDNPAIQTTGNFSYSWYLWHWPILVFVGTAATPLSMLERLGCVFASWVLAGLTYTLLENRVRFSPILSLSPLCSLALGIALTLIGTGSALTLSEFAKSSLISMDQAQFSRAREDLPKVYADGCHLPHRAVDLPQCVYGDPTALKTIVLFGDSHAAQWFPAIEQMAWETGWRLVSLTKSACPSAWVTPYNTALGRDYEECARWRLAVVRRIVAENPALVILANYSSYYMRGPHAIRTNEWREGTRQILAEIRRSGASVIVLRDTPSPGFDMPTCLSRASWRHKDMVSACSFDRNNSLNAETFELEQAAVAKMDGAMVLDLSNLVCTDSVCQPMIGGQVAYRDSHHLTARTSASLAPALSVQLKLN